MKKKSVRNVRTFTQMQMVLARVDARRGKSNFNLIY